MDYFMMTFSFVFVFFWPFSLGIGFKRFRTKSALGGQQKSVIGWIERRAEYGTTSKSARTLPLCVCSLAMIHQRQTVAVTEKMLFFSACHSYSMPQASSYLSWWVQGEPLRKLLTSIRFFWLIYCSWVISIVWFTFKVILCARVHDHIHAESKRKYRWDSNKNDWSRERNEQLAKNDWRTTWKYLNQ